MTRNLLPLALAVICSAVFSPSRAQVNAAAVQKAAAVPAVPSLFRAAAPAFGGELAVLVVEDKPGAPVAAQAAVSEVARVEQLLSLRDDSQLGRLNAAAGGDAVALDPEVFDVLVAAQLVAQRSQGAFDLTAGGLVDAWHFGEAAEGGHALPDAQALAERRALVGFRDLELDARTKTARLRLPGTRLALFDVAAAYALKRASALLTERGYDNHLLSLGGDVVAAGEKASGTPWQVGLQDPRAPGHFAALTLPKAGAAVFTSADFENYFFDGGVRYHAVLDPRTGKPGMAVRSASVVAADPISAAAAARAAFVLGPNEGLRLVERLGGSAVIVSSTNAVVSSKAVKGSLRSRPPTDGP